MNPYLNHEIQTADPLNLICMLYRAAIVAVGAARAHVRAGQIRARSLQIVKAFEILQELGQSLDPNYAEISRPLAELYAYMQTRLIEANTKQIEPPLEEVESLLTTLLEGWRAAASVPLSAEYEPVSCTY